MKTMKTIVFEKYGPPEVLQTKIVEVPTPKDNEVLVKIRATSVTIGDTIMRSLKIPGPRWMRIMARLALGIWRPRKKVLGMELAGDIEAVGKKVTRFKVGDAIFASTFSVKFGGYAEYKCFPQDGMLLTKPSHLSYEEAAVSVGGGVTALCCLKKASIHPGYRVLIYGASGAVGTNAVQIAKHHYGAEVVGVCSTRNLEMVKALGADKVIDYTRQDFTQSGERYDLIFDAVGKLDASQGKKALKAKGVYLSVHTDSGSGTERVSELNALRELLVQGKVKPFIDRCYPFEEIVEAHRYVEKGHKRGNVAIIVAQNES